MQVDNKKGNALVLDLTPRVEGYMCLPDLFQKLRTKLTVNVFNGYRFAVKTCGPIKVMMVEIPHLALKNPNDIYHIQNIRTIPVVYDIARRVMPELPENSKPYNFLVGGQQLKKSDQGDVHLTACGSMMDAHGAVSCAQSILL